MDVSQFSIVTQLVLLLSTMLEYPGELDVLKLLSFYRCLSKQFINLKHTGHQHKQHVINFQVYIEKVKWLCGCTLIKESFHPTIHTMISRESQSTHGYGSSRKTTCQRSWHLKRPRHTLPHVLLFYSTIKRSCSNHGQSAINYSLNFSHIWQIPHLWLRMTKVTMVGIGYV